MESDERRPSPTVCVRPVGVERYYRKKPLLEGKKRLARLLKTPRDGLDYVEHLEGDGETIFEHACKLKLEGIVSKRVDSLYRSGPSRSWRKVKNREHPAYLRVIEALR
jgi:ATP-dependent DNA ligase